jgi:hypothetical protein
MFCHHIVFVLIQHPLLYACELITPRLLWTTQGLRFPFHGSTLPWRALSRNLAGPPCAYVCGARRPPADPVRGSATPTARRAAQPRSDQKGRRCVVGNLEAHAPLGEQCPYQPWGRSEPNQFPRTGARNLSRLIRTPAFSQYVESPSGHRPNCDVSHAVDLV